MTTTALSLLLGVYGCSASRPADVQASEALRRLEEHPEGLTSVDVRAISAALTASKDTSGQDVWRQLRPAILNRRTPIPARDALLELACRKADSAVACEILDLASSWLPATSRAESSPSGPTTAPSDTDTLFFTVTCRGLLPVAKACQDKDRVLRFVERALPRSNEGATAVRSLAAVIAQVPGPLPGRRRLALRIIAAGDLDAWGFDWGEFALLLDDPDAIRELRELARKAGRWGGVRRGAAAALAHLGDGAILPDLEEWIQADRTGAGELRECVRKIQLQHPPSQLIDFIAKVDATVVFSDLPSWAIGRADELGLPRERVRAAALACLERHKDDPFQVFLIRRVVLKRGLLSTEDLTRFPEPEMPTP